MLIHEVLITWAHLLAASIWVGGTLFIGMVVAPVLRSLGDVERFNLTVKMGKRFNKVALPTIVVLLATGVYKASTVPGFLLDTMYGTILFVKVGVVISMLVTWFVHAKISNVNMDVNDSVNLMRVRKRAILLGNVLAAESLTVLLLAAMLDSF
ncbi:MAG: hypothetical protein RMJ59_07330 [Candidatus Nitrosocaldus sp.]|nr:hypothetical protein [Candidatus Nitrosocaldus sp.]MCS7141712.1 hypothetical protein [Candidatus Nitrosocaldus sp.]MDW8000730.1 hypothetical protein [Candidatus Nitrosocaldus sp.]MDW8276171.1 hypothetical protein [Candidatus Nitrosocaldus sp.]